MQLSQEYTPQHTTLPVFENWSPTMARAEYDGNTWSAVSFSPVAPLTIAPGAMALQFGASVFEGMKARRADVNEAYIFRGDENYQRLCRSARRLCLPYPDPVLFDAALDGIVSNCANWQSPFSSEWLYLRPLIYAMDDHLMPVTSRRALFLLLAAPIRAYRPATFSLRVEQHQHRAAPGGLGAAKTAANYAHQFQATQAAHSAGYQAVLWLSALDNHTIEEASTMNVFFVVGDTVITPLLSDRVLAGITRQSAISLIRGRGIRVIERNITLEEVMQASQQRKLRELFVTSTALGVRAVDYLQIGERRIATANNPCLSAELAVELENIQAGRCGSDTSGWLRPVALHREA
jgi:branched-chain amino acid aminotransferase